MRPRPRHLLAASALLVAFSAASFAPAGAFAAGRPAGGPAKPSTIEKVVNCTHHAVVEPKNFVITCADANEALSGLHWTVWKTGVAEATGTYTMNDCTPNCAAGKFLHFAARVQLAGERHTSLGLVFTTLRWQYMVKGRLQREIFTLVA